MATFKPVKFFTTTWMVVRHKSKPQIQKTRIPHWTRLQTLETCKPIFLPNQSSPDYQCELSNVQQENKLTTYERLLGEQMLKFLDESPMVGLFHSNSITERARQPLVKMMFYGDMTMKTYNRLIVRLTLQGTKYEALIPLFVSHTRFVFGKKVDVDALLTIQKKWPAYLLLAGVVDNRILSRDDLVYYSKMKNLDTVRAQLCHTLDYASQNMLQNLTHHQMQLGMALDTLAKSSDDKLQSNSVS